MLITTHKLSLNSTMYLFMSLEFSEYFQLIQTLLYKLREEGILTTICEMVLFWAVIELRLASTMYFMLMTPYPNTVNG